MANINSLSYNSAGVPVAKVAGTTRAQRTLSRLKNIATRTKERSSNGTVKINPLRLNSGGQVRF